MSPIAYTSEATGGVFQALWSVSMETKNINVQGAKFTLFLFHCFSIPYYTYSYTKESPHLYTTYNTIATGLSFTVFIKYTWAIPGPFI